MLKCNNYCDAWISVLHIELQNTDHQGMRQVVNCYLRKLLLSSKGKKQSQVNRTFWVSGKAIKRNKETPGGDVQIDFVTPHPTPREMVYLLHSSISKVVMV